MALSTWSALIPDSIMIDLISSTCLPSATVIFGGAMGSMSAYRGLRTHLLPHRPGARLNGRIAAFDFVEEGFGVHDHALLDQLVGHGRSEERRVGKEWRGGWLGAEGR